MIRIVSRRREDVAKISCRHRRPVLVGDRVGEECDGTFPDPRRDFIAEGVPTEVVGTGEWQKIHAPSLEDLARVQHSQRVEHGLDLALNIELVVTEFIP